MQQQHQAHTPLSPIDRTSVRVTSDSNMYNSYYSYPQAAYQQQQQGSIAHLLSPDARRTTSELGSPAEFAAAGPTPPAVREDGGNSRKRARTEHSPDDDDDGEDSPPASNEKDEVKVKATRGSRACTVCRRLKMKCVGAEHGPPCKRCISGKHECVFEESNRGKRSNKKQEVLARSLRKMERTLDTVLRSIGNPALASELAASRSPSPVPPSASTSTQHTFAPASRPSVSPVQALVPSPSPSLSTRSGAYTSSSGSRLPIVLAHHHLDVGAPGAPPSPKLHSLPDNSLNPLGLLAEASLANRRAQAANSPTDGPLAGAPDSRVGVASDLYFKPGPMTILPLRRLAIERQIQPEMLKFVSNDEVVDLFNIYFDHLNPHCNLLDRNFHTPSLVCSRSPFMLTTICAIAAKFYTPRPELHTRLTDLTKKLAWQVPAMGYKSVEIVQAYLLLTLWGTGPVERYEQDNTWLMLGMAIRVATDLNLHRQTLHSTEESVEGKAREVEVRNRERTWIMAFILDRSFSAQMGKPYTIQEDPIIRNAGNWGRAPQASLGDRGLSAYAELQRVVSRCLDVLGTSGGNAAPFGLHADMDYLLVIKTMETQLAEWHREFSVPEHDGERVHHYMSVMASYYVNYALLVINSFGLQNALARAPADIAHFFSRCHHAATVCATHVRDVLGPEGFLKYSPDSHFVQSSYAVLSLLKLIRPEFQAFLEQEEKTINLVRGVADQLERVAAGPTHTPALYSTFLRALISNRLAPAPETNDPMLATHANGHVNGHGNGDTNMQDYAMPSPAYGLPQIREDGTHTHSSPAIPPSVPSQNPMDLAAYAQSMGPPQASGSGAHTQAVQDEFFSMDAMFSSGFWDNVLVPGFSNPMDPVFSNAYLSGGFVHGAGGTGMITPRLALSPLASGANSPQPPSLIPQGYVAAGGER